MRTVLICHEDAELDLEGLGRWLASFSDLVGILVLQERKQRLWQRIRREWRRVGGYHFLDVLAFRFYYRLFLAGRDRRWQKQELENLARKYASIPKSTRFLYTQSPNSAEAKQFLRGLNPHILLARCKFILKEEIFTIPALGTFVMHPGICPEYRNAHGCFWALARRDLEKVGMTLLRVDTGIDTGPVYGYYTYDYDEINESHTVIQHRVTLENLEKLEKKLCEIGEGRATPLDTSGRRSGVWGQPWLSEYIKWKKLARKRNREDTLNPVPRRH
jgi:Formyl transferase